MNRHQLTRRVEEFDDGGTPQWRRTQSEFLIPRKRGLVGWYQRASPLGVYVGTVLMLGTAVVLLIVGSFVGLVIYDAVTR